MNGNDAITFEALEEFGVRIRMARYEVLKRF